MFNFTAHTTGRALTRSLLAFELMRQSVLLQDRRYQFYLSLDSFNDI
jgi:hypothetical protein